MTEQCPEVALPPNADESEIAVIAAVIGIPDQLDVAMETGVQPEHFRHPVLQNVFRVAVRLSRAGVRQIDAGLIVQAPDSGLDTAHDIDELGRLLDHPYLIGDVDAHCRQVIAAAQRREVTYALRHGLSLIGDGRPADEVHAAVGAEMDRVFDGGAGGPEPIGDVLLRLAERPDDVGQGLSSGLTSLDETLSGLRPGNLIVLAARPGHGKTALAASIALTAARAGEGVLFVSLEMAAEELAERLLSLQSGVSHARVRDGRLDEVEHEQVTVAQNELASMPLRILDRTPIRVSDITTAVRLAKCRHRLKLLIVDYLQLLEPSDRKLIREQQVADQSRALKTLAKSAGIPVLCLAQLNRAIETRDDKRPRLSDLRESGAIEQDADSVLFLHRAGVSDPDADERVATLSIAKNRHGQTDEVRLEWIGHRMEYREADL